MSIMRRTYSYCEQIFRQIAAIVNATVRYNKSLDSRLVFDAWVVKTCVQHDDGEWQYIACVCTTATHTHEQLCSLWPFATFYHQYSINITCHKLCIWMLNQSPAKSECWVLGPFSNPSQNFTEIRLLLEHTVKCQFTLHLLTIRNPE